MKLSEGSSALPAPFCFTWLLNAFKPEKYTHRLGQIQYLPHRRYNKVALGVFAQLEKSSAKQMTEQLKPICMCLKKNNTNDLHFGVPTCRRMGKHNLPFLSWTCFTCLLTAGFFLENKKSVPRMLEFKIKINWNMLITANSKHYGGAFLPWIITP